VKKASWFWVSGIIGLSVIAGLATLVDILEPIRVLSISIFFLIGPGLPWVRLFDIDELLTELVLGIALSIALDTVVATIMVYIGVWMPVIGMGILMNISVIGVFVNVYRETRKRKSVESKP
jgi:hypothetical protein